MQFRSRLGLGLSLLLLVLGLPCLSGCADMGWASTTTQLRWQATGKLNWDPIDERPRALRVHCVLLDERGAAEIDRLESGFGSVTSTERNAKRMPGFVDYLTARGVSTHRVQIRVHGTLDAEVGEQGELEFESRGDAAYLAVWGDYAYPASGASSQRAIVRLDELASHVLQLDAHQLGFERR
jgi:hypothetical protein